MFLNAASLRSPSWQAFERMIFRLLKQEGYAGVRLVGRSGDGGADLVAKIANKRWLFQAKKWNRAVGHSAVDEIVNALRVYDAKVPVIVSLNGFEKELYTTQTILHSQGIPLQLWDRTTLLDRAQRVRDLSLVEKDPGRFEGRNYQEEAIQSLCARFIDGHSRKALVVMATGLGKTFVSAEFVRRVSLGRSVRILSLAHTNELVYQLERSFWPFLRPSQETIVWNGIERPDAATLQRADFVFACIDTVYGAISRGETLPTYDILLVDECHHATSSMYVSSVSHFGAGREGGPFLLGLTATPWRADGSDVEELFGQPVLSIDLVTGMRNGFLSQVDYRIFTSNIDWEKLAQLRGSMFSPKAINRALFITEWDDGVVFALRDTWHEQDAPRGIVFCGTIDHALQMRDRINALGFCRAAAVFSSTSGGESMPPWERNRILSDFEEGRIGVICAVDIFNEGIDVPDVNILVFQRVTHSRRIFMQQLGRGLRLSPGKKKVIVLDFVSDVRRFAATIDLKHKLEAALPSSRVGSQRVRLNSSVRFLQVGGTDTATETFLSQWLGDVAEIEQAGDDAHVLRFPPIQNLSKKNGL